MNTEADLVGEMKKLYGRSSAAKARSNGEIYTPVSLAGEMLDGLPKSVWRNENGRWLDPAAGFGVFGILAFFRLMKGLAQKIPDSSARARHIVKNMLFMVELDEANASLARSLFSRVTPEPVNIRVGDYLKWDDAARFDVVMGNPPYNSGGYTKGGAFWYSYWVPFVLDSVARLNSKGFLVFVHPPGWRKPAGDTKSSGDVWKLFRREGSLLRLVIHGERSPPFPEVDWYVWQRGRSRSKKTKVTSGGRDAALSLGGFPFLPGTVTLESMGVLRKVLASGDDDRTYNFQRDNRFRFSAGEAKGTIPHAHYWVDSLRTYKTLNLKAKQVEAMYPKGEPGFYRGSKVVMSMNASKEPGCLYPVHYAKGKRMGVTTNVMYQEMSEGDARDCVRFFSSELVRFVMSACQYSPAPNRKNEPKVVNSLRIPPRSALESETSLAEYYGLTSDEADLVKNVMKCCCDRKQ